MLRRIRRRVLHFRLNIYLLVFIIIFVSLIALHIERENFHSSLILADRTLIFVRTSVHCESRLKYLLNSWIPVQQSNFYLLTDQLSEKNRATNVWQAFLNVIETNCSQTHSRLDLCCKTANEFALYYNLTTRSKTNIDWLCRFDDDQYVNTKNLYVFLATMNASESYYIGRTSISYRLRANDYNRTFTFATYGAGVCFSRGLLTRLRPYVNVTVLPHGCVKRGISDDAYIGFTNEILLNTSLTSINDRFHSHLESLNRTFRQFNLTELRRAITFGFAWDRYQLNWLPVIHELIQLANKDQQNAAQRLWIFMRNYERDHPENLLDKYDDSCTSYRRNKKPLLSSTTAAFRTQSKIGYNISTRHS